MKSQRRWMKWVLAEAAKPQIAMPWHRSGARAVTIARRPPTLSQAAAQPAAPMRLPA